MVDLELHLPFSNICIYCTCLEPPDIIEQNKKEDLGFFGVRTEPEFVNLLRNSGIDFQPGRPVR
jgi:hypothetical protein